MKSRIVAITATGLTSLLLGACAGSAVDATFGDAVRSTREAQVYDQATLANPPSDTSTPTDGQRMETVLEGHRGQAGDSQAVGNPIVINVGN